MKILIISYYFPPLNSIASLRPYSWAKYWSKMGHDVTVLTTHEPQRDNDLNMDCSSFKVIRVINPVKSHFKHESNQAESNQSTLPLRSILLSKIKQFLQSRGIMATARMPDFNDFIITASCNSVSFECYDLAISTSGPYSEHLIAKKLRKNNIVKFWIADYRDLWTQNHIFEGLFPFTAIEEYLEKKVNTTADIITTVSEPLAQQIRQKYGLTNVHVIENGFDTDDLENISSSFYWNDDKIRLVYTGSIYRGKQNPSPLFEAIHNIKYSQYSKLLEKFEVIFAGAPSNLNELIEHYNISDYVKYAGFLPREDALRMQRDAHILLFLEFEAPNIDGILTGKLFEYLASETQIWGIGVSELSTLGQIIYASGHGINFGKESKKIEKNLIDLLLSQSKPLIKKNEALLQKYSRKNQADMILSLVNASITI